MENPMKSLFLAKWQTFIRYHELSGSRTTLVYLPGLSVPSVVAFLSVATHSKLREHHAILIDYLGSGFSDHPQDFDYSIENHAESVAAILDHEGIRNCAVIGQSMGGTVGIMLAIQRPDLVSNLIVGEGNINPGGGMYSRRIASYSKSEYINEVHAAFLEERRQDAISGDTMAASIGGIWGTADPAGVYGNSLALVELEPSFKERFLQLPIPRTYIYGEKSLPENSGEVRADAPDPKELEAPGIHIAVVPNAGHSMMRDNLSGYVDILQIALEAQR
jgi:pimeloyl-ACP methyl ester carboxylesterase